MQCKTLCIKLSYPHWVELHNSKVHFNLFRNKKNYVPLNLNRLQYFIDCGRIDISEPINMNTLWTTGAVSRVGDGVCLLGTVSFLSF